MADGSLMNLSQSSAGTAVSIGNYKGVMLCNRPFNGVSTTLAKEAKGNNNSGGSKGAFLAGIPSEPIGQNVPIYIEPVHAIKRDKKNSALSKHKKWLHELQKERQRLQQALLEDEEEQEARKQRFAQREAKFREEIRANNGSSTNGPETDEHVGEDDGKEIFSSTKKDKKLSRPMWALTKEIAEEKKEFLEEAEADDLINFANNLDLDQFMDDVEIKAKVAQVEQQLAQIQSIVDHEEAQEKRDEREQQRIEEGKSVPLNANDLARLDHMSAKGNDEDDVMSVASTVLSECKSIRSVHSVRSVAALTKRAEAKLSASLDEVTPSTPDITVKPKVVTIDEENGVRLQIKNLPSNLPYIHRNPAI